MAAGTTPIFVATIHNEFPHTDGDGGAAGAMKTQNLNVDGSGTLLTLWTATANGGIITNVVFRPAGTNILSVARLFIFDGTNTQLFDEFTLNATTASTNTALQQYIWTPPNTNGILRMQASHKLKMTLGTTVAAGYFASCLGSDF